MARPRGATGPAFAAVEIAATLDATEGIAVRLGGSAVRRHEALDATPEHAEGSLLVRAAVHVGGALDAVTASLIAERCRAVTLLGGRAARRARTGEWIARCAVWAVAVVAALDAAPDAKITMKTVSDALVGGATGLAGGGERRTTGLRRRAFASTARRGRLGGTWGAGLAFEVVRGPVRASSEARGPRRIFRCHGGSSPQSAGAALRGPRGGRFELRAVRLGWQEVERRVAAACGDGGQRGDGDSG